MIIPPYQYVPYPNPLYMSQYSSYVNTPSYYGTGSKVELVDEPKNLINRIFMPFNKLMCCFSKAQKSLGRGLAIFIGIIALLTVAIVFLSLIPQFKNLTKKKNSFTIDVDDAFKKNNSELFRLLLTAPEIRSSTDTEMLDTFHASLITQLNNKTRGKYPEKIDEITNIKLTPTDKDIVSVSFKLKTKPISIEESNELKKRIDVLSKAEDFFKDIFFVSKVAPITSALKAPNGVKEPLLINSNDEDIILLTKKSKQKNIQKPASQIPVSQISFIPQKTPESHVPILINNEKEKQIRQQIVSPNLQTIQNRPAPPPMPFIPPATSQKPAINPTVFEIRPPVIETRPQILEYRPQQLIQQKPIIMPQIKNPFEGKYLEGKQIINKNYKPFNQNKQIIYKNIHELDSEHYIIKLTTPKPVEDYNKEIKINTPANLVTVEHKNFLDNYKQIKKRPPNYVHLNTQPIDSKYYPAHKLYPFKRPQYPLNKIFEINQQPNNYPNNQQPNNYPNNQQPNNYPNNQQQIIKYPNQDQYRNPFYQNKPQNDIKQNYNGFTYGYKNNDQKNEYKQIINDKAYNKNIQMYEQNNSYDNYQTRYQNNYENQNTEYSNINRQENQYEVNNLNPYPPKKDIILIQLRRNELDDSTNSTATTN